MPAGQGYGLSFQPGAETQNGQPGAQRGAQTPVQRAIQLLSLRLPSVLGARPIAPRALLAGQGASGLPGGAQALLLLQRLFGGGGLTGGQFAGGQLTDALPTARAAGTGAGVPIVPFAPTAGRDRPRIIFDQPGSEPPPQVAPTGGQKSLADLQQTGQNALSNFQQPPDPFGTGYTAGLGYPGY